MVSIETKYLPELGLVTVNSVAPTPVARTASIIPSSSTSTDHVMLAIFGPAGEFKAERTISGSPSQAIISNPRNSSRNVQSSAVF